MQIKLRRIIIGLGVTVALAAACLIGMFISSTKQPTPYVQVWASAGSIKHDSAPPILGYGSHIILVEGATYKLRMYSVNDGQITPEGSIIFNPESRPFVALTPVIQDGQAVFELGGPISIRSTGSYKQTSEYIQATVRLPDEIGCNLGSATRNAPIGEKLLVAYWIRETAEAESHGLPTRSIPSMIEASKNDDLSFVYVTVEQIP